MAGIVLTLLSVSAPTSANAQAGATLEDVRDQGILYYRKKLFKQARARLEAARKMPGGDTDFRTTYYLAQASYRLMFLEQAFVMADQAKALAGSKARRKQSAADLIGEMKALYGAVQIVRAPQETKGRGRIFFEVQTGIINKDKKQRFMSIRERFRATDLELPAKLYLPYGTYLANGVQFTISENEPTPTVPIFLQVGEDDSGGSTSMNSRVWWYVGGGVAVAAALGAGAVFLMQAPEPDQANISLNF
jgi:hypothetical protein